MYQYVIWYETVTPKLLWYFLLQLKLNAAKNSLKIIQVFIEKRTIWGTLKKIGIKSTCSIINVLKRRLLNKMLYFPTEWHFLKYIFWIKNLFQRGKNSLIIWSIIKNFFNKREVLSLFYYCQWSRNHFWIGAIEGGPGVGGASKTIELKKFGKLIY